jgi:hypothetical protein
MKIKLIAIITIVSLTALAGCKDPITGKDLYTGSLEVVNEYSGPIGAVSVWTEANGGGERIWANPPGLNIPYNNSKFFSDVPTGTWSVFVAGSYINNVAIVGGLTTTVTRTSGGGLTAGLPH